MVPERVRSTREEHDLREKNSIGSPSPQQSLNTIARLVTYRTAVPRPRRMLLQHTR